MKKAIFCIALMVSVSSFAVSNSGISNSAKYLKESQKVYSASSFYKCLFANSDIFQIKTIQYPDYQAMRRQIKELYTNEDFLQNMSRVFKDTFHVDITTDFIKGEMLGFRNIMKVVKEKRDIRYLRILKQTTGEVQFLFQNYLYGISKTKQPKKFLGKNLNNVQLAI